MDHDDLTPAAADDAEPRARRRARLTRRTLLIGGAGVVGLGGASLVYRALRRREGPVGAWHELAPIVPVVLPSPRPLSPAAEQPGVATTLTIWAHADDDIIFANPSLSDAIASGHTVRAVYVTAGDGGRGLDYALERESGIRSAYDEMRGSSVAWETQQITLLSGARVTRFVPGDQPSLSITTMRLPDGNLDGDGFASTGSAGLTQLINGDVSSLSPIDGAPAYDRAGLSATIAELIDAARPERLTTNIPHESAYARGDHPDHSCVGSLVRAIAPTVGIAPTAVSYYIGYPSQDQPVNVEGTALGSKVETYRAYAADDSVVRCADDAACLAQPGFGEWLRRTYPKTESELQLT